MLFNRPLRHAPLFAALVTALCGAGAAQATNGWQVVAASCVPLAQSAKIGFVGTKTGAIGLKAGKAGSLSLICPVNYEFSGTNVLDQIELMYVDTSPAGSVSATLLRKSKTSGATEILATASSVDSPTLAKSVASFTPTSINFFTHAVYVVLQLSRSDEAADVQAHMVHLSRFIP